MPDLGAAGKPGISDSHLNLVGGAPIAALEGHWRRNSKFVRKTLAKTKGNHGSRQSLCPRIAHFALTAKH